MTTGRINQVTIVSLPGPGGTRAVTNRTRVLSQQGVSSQGINTFRWAYPADKRLTRRSTVSPAELTTNIPRSHKFPRHSWPPHEGETQPPQGEDCDKPAATHKAGHQTHADLQIIQAFRFNPSASNPHSSHLRDARHIRTAPDLN